MIRVGSPYNPGPMGFKMSKNRPMFWNCPGIVAKVGPDWWNRGDWWDDWWDDGSYWAGYLVKLPMAEKHRRVGMIRENVESEFCLGFI